MRSVGVSTLLLRSLSHSTTYGKAPMHRHRRGLLYLLLRHTHTANIMTNSHHHSHRPKQPQNHLFPMADKWGKGIFPSPVASSPHYASLATTVTVASGFAFISSQTWPICLFGRRLLLWFLGVPLGFDAAVVCNTMHDCAVQPCVRTAGQGVSNKAGNFQKENFPLRWGMHIGLSKASRRTTHKTQYVYSPSSAATHKVRFLPKARCRCCCPWLSTSSASYCLLSLAISVSDLFPPSSHGWERKTLTFPWKYARTWNEQWGNQSSQCCHLAASVIRV